MSAQHDELRPTDGCDRSGSLGHLSSQQISTGFAYCLRYCSDVAHRRPTKLCTMFGRLLGWYTMYTFSGLLPPDRILPGAIFTLRPSLAFAYIGLAALLLGTPAACVSQAFRRRTRMELPNFRRGRHLYSAGRPSRWASAHILACTVISNITVWITLSK